MKPAPASARKIGFDTMRRGPPAPPSSEGETRWRVRSYDFVQDRTHDGRLFRTLNNEPLSAIGPRTMASDAFTKEALVIRVDRKLNSTDVVDALTDLFIMRGPPEFIRSDNGAEFIARKVRAWIGAVGARTAFIEPGSPWENGYCESFNARFRDELLNVEVFYSLREAQILIERWRRHYNFASLRPSFYVVEGNRFC